MVKYFRDNYENQIKSKIKIKIKIKSNQLTYVNMVIPVKPHIIWRQILFYT